MNILDDDKAIVDAIGIYLENEGYRVLKAANGIEAIDIISIERFNRGDESRTSQGRGLGLSIAQSPIENQKGKFIIQVDGDLFKSIILMPKQ